MAPRSSSLGRTGYRDRGPRAGLIGLLTGGLCSAMRGGGLLRAGGRVITPARAARASCRRPGVRRTGNITKHAQCDDMVRTFLLVTRMENETVDCIFITRLLLCQ